jgi:hypothetical protein
VATEYKEERSPTRTALFVPEFPPIDGSYSILNAEISKH